MRRLIKKIKKIHFVGIKGVGVAPLALIAKDAGIDVSGSDVEEVFITDRQLIDAGIKIFSGFNPENVSGADLVITTGAHGGFSNVESIAAKEKGIPVISQAQALGLFMNGEIFGKKFEGVAVCGSHGKTTTSSMISTVLKVAGMDPSYAIGTGHIPSLGSSGHLGSGKYFIAEADEYVVDIENDRTPKLFFLSPRFIVVTNVDFDHPDVYKSIEEVRKVFLEFAERLSQNGLLIACGDSLEDKKLLSEYKGRKISFGASPVNDINIKKVSMNDQQMFFWVESKGTLLGEFSTQVFGEQNAINALSSIAFGLEIGLSVEQIKKGLASFRGSKRRSEFIGRTKNDAFVYDDYAHHPEEIKKTLAAFKNAFPKKRIVAIFQPHMYSRTKKLLEQFISSFSQADEVIISEIFASFREETDPSFSAKLISDGIGRKSAFKKSLEDVIEYADKKNYSGDTVLVVMGAGDVYKVAERLVL